MAIKLPRFDRSLPLITEKLTATVLFHTWWDKVAKNLETVISSLEAAVIEIQNVLNIADTAQAAAAAAQSAADAAQSAADSAQQSANDATGITSVVNSGVDSNPLSAEDAGSDASIVIATHSRLYPNGTSVTVTGGTLTGLDYSTEYWVFYDDPNRAGGSVTYQTTTIEATAAQAGDRHLVGKITTPAALDPPTNGLWKKYPGLELT